MLQKRTVTTAVTTLMVTVLTAVPALAVTNNKDSVDQIIKSQTGKSATKAAAKETVGSMSVTSGRDKSGKALESYSQREGKSVVMMSVIEDESQQSIDYSLALPKGAKVLPTSNGSLVVTNPKGKGLSALVGTIERPWARDANGKQLATSYTHSGGVLTQQVDTKGATFPIVADPTLTFGLGVYLNMYGWEIRGLGMTASAVFGVSVILSCANVSKVPHWVARSLGQLLCGLLGAVTAKAVLESILHFYRYRAIVANQCYQMRITGQRTGFYPVRTYGNCRFV